jgi:hypothetical protein
MKDQCDVCGAEVDGLAFFGRINGITVCFCREHKEDCLNSESCNYEIVLK